jgi:hypothetical protein
VGQLVLDLGGGGGGAGATGSNSGTTRIMSSGGPGWRTPTGGVAFGKFNYRFTSKLCWWWRRWGLNLQPGPTFFFPGGSGGTGGGGAWRR